MRITKFFNLFIVLLIFWSLLTLNITLINIIIGVLVSLVIAYFSYSIIYQTSMQKQKMKLSKLPIYLFILFFQIYRSSFTYIYRMFSKNCYPTIIEIDIEISNPFIISIIANSITLTPGTVTIDYIDHKLILLAFCNSKHNEEKIKTDIKKSFMKYFNKKG